MDEQPPTCPTAACRGPKCRAIIIWAVTEGRGKDLPVDVEPVSTGNVLLTGRPGRAPIARVVGNPAELFGKRFVYQPHFASCPHAQQYRTPR